MMMKTILITGSTDGIGKLTALKLAQAGHKVLLHGRNSEKLKASISEVKSSAGHDLVQGYLADLSDLSSIAELADKIHKNHSKIDVLINNAGVFKSSQPILDSGLDVRMVVNYLAPVLLTTRLIPALNNSNAPRVINLSSAAQEPVSLAALKGIIKLSDQGAYAQSKLALTMWSFYLTQKQSDLMTIAVNPGSLLNTKMVQEAYGQFWSPVDKGANILFELATSDKYQQDSGKYFDNDKGNPQGTFANAHAEAYDLDKIQGLVETTDQLLSSYN